MDERDDGIDEARAATITANIDRAFAFVADVIDDPAILERIPDDPRRVIREARVGGHHLRLAAYRPEVSERWGISVTGGIGEADVSGENLPTRPIAPEIMAT
jgi:hypothetical protein